MNQRDENILKALKFFKVANRRQLERLCFPNLKDAKVTANRVLKRLERDGYILQFPQPKDRPYNYMPNPAVIHHQSSKLDHHLKIVDLYLSCGAPEKFVIDPKISEEYMPDVFMTYQGRSVIVEVQLTPISLPRMKHKIDMFLQTYGKQHKVQELWILTNKEYGIDVPAPFKLIQKALSV